MHVYFDRKGYEMKKGDALLPLVKAPITREQLKLYAEASGDYNPIHQEDSIAQKMGLPGVIAHGMLSMAFIGEFLYQAMAELHPFMHGQNLGQKSGKIAEFSSRFKAMAFPGDVITVSGTIREIDLNQVECDLEARNQKNEITTTGYAVLIF
jgi:acyl dehydratase